MIYRPCRSASLLFLALVATFAAAPSHAQTPIYWQGGNGSLINPNYTGTAGSGLTPGSTNEVWFGGESIGTLSGQSAEFGRLRVGQQNGGLVGAATVTIDNGASLTLSSGGTGINTSGLVVGHNRAGTLIIDGPGTTVTVSILVVIGAAATPPADRSSTLRLTNGGTLNVNSGNITLGTTNSETANGMPGHLIVENGTVQMFGNNSTLNIGNRKAKSTVRLDNGYFEVGGNTEVGPVDSLVGNESTFTINGGTFTGFGHFFVGRGKSTGATAYINGGVVNVGNRFMMLGQTATGAVTNHSGGTLNAGVDIRVADAAASAGADATYNLSGTGVINSTGGGIIGRQGIGRFNQTGGLANFMDLLSIGNREEATLATNGLYKISAGELKAGASIGTDALSIAPNGTGEFRVVGDDSTIDVLGNFLVNNTVNGIGTLAFELQSGDLLSRVNVTNAATFQAGSKLVFDISNALPTQTSYDLLTATSIVDEGLAFTGPAGWNFQIVAGGAGQILRASGPLVAVENADFNGDGTVNGNDFLAWQRNFGKAAGATLAEGDANGDGAVNAADLGIWKSKFGGAAAPVAAAVPEPGSLGLALLAACAIARFRKK